MDVVAAYERVGTYRGAAAISGVDPKTVKRKIEAHRRGVLDEDRPNEPRCRRTPTSCATS